MAQRVESFVLSAFLCFSLSLHTVHQGSRLDYCSACNLQEFKYVWLSPASLLKRANATFQSAGRHVFSVKLIKSCNPACRHCKGRVRETLLRCVEHSRARLPESHDYYRRLRPYNPLLSDRHTVLQMVVSHRAAGKCRPHNA